MHEIGRAFDRGHSSIQKILMATGGIRPAVRKRSRLALSLAEREEISRGLVAGFSFRLIADRRIQSPDSAKMTSLDFLLSIPCGVEFSVRSPTD